MEEKRLKVRMSIEGVTWDDYYLIWWFHGHATQQGWSSSEIEAVLAIARAGDHDHLVSTLMDHIEDPSGEQPRGSIQTEPDRTHLITALGKLSQAAFLARLACESLSPVIGMAKQWERIRDLAFALRAEWGRLEEHL